tara:strand:- start:8370 stop:10793 length:2424 start_codon:yes stop_codon:yes gene_type:complete
MIIHSPILSGSLAFAEGATLNSSLIPNASASIDLGSAAYPFKDIYVSSNTLKLGGLKLGGLGESLSIKKADDSPADIGAKSITIGGIGVSNSKKFSLNTNNKVTLLDENDDVDTLEVNEIILKDTSGAGKNTKLTNDGGKFTTQETADNGSVTSQDAEGSLSGSFTGSIQDGEFNGEATFNDGMAVTGTTALAVTNVSGLASLDGGVDVDGAFTVANTSGNVVTTGTLSAGATTVSGLTIGSTAVTSTAAELNLLDTSVAGTITNSKALIYGDGGEVNATKLQVGGVDITSTPAELNLLDGVTGLVKADFTKLAAVTATAAQVNFLADADLEAADLTKLAAVTATAAQVNFLADGDLEAADLTKLAAVTSTATELNLLDDVSGLVKADFTKLAAVTSTAAHLNFVDGVTSGIQGQINAKASLASPTFTGVPITTTPASNDSSTKIASTAYVQGELTDLIGGASAAFDTLLEISASIANGDSDVVALTETVGGKMTKSSNLGDLTDAAAARGNLGIAIGTDVQAYNATLAAVAGSTYSGDNAITTVGTISTGVWNGTAINASYLDGQSGTNTGDESDASATVKGIVELATTSETTIGTDTIRAVTPDGLKDGYQGSTNVTTLGTITTGTWNGTAISSANLDSDTAHLSGTQTFSGAKAFTENITANGLLSVTGAGTSTFNSHLKAHCLGIGMDPSYTTGEIVAAADIIAYASSDKRLKENIKPIENPLGKIAQISGNTFDWIENSEVHSHKGSDIGVIAQEIEAVLPELVTTRENGYKAVQYDKVVALLIEAVKEQQTQIDELKSKLN